MSRSALWRQEGAKKMREKEAEDLFSMAVEEGRNNRSKSLPLWGPDDSFHFNPVLLEKIIKSRYFQKCCREITDWNKLVDEIYYSVQDLEPWTVGGQPSNAFCLLLRLLTLRCSEKQMRLLLDHVDSPYIRGIGFLYLRYAGEPTTIWGWIQPYLNDDEPITVTATSSKNKGRQDHRPKNETIGDFVRRLFSSERDFYGTMLPRLPIQVERDLQVKLLFEEKIKERAKRHLSNFKTMDYFKTLGSRVMALYGDDENPITWYEGVVDQVILRDKASSRQLAVPKFVVTFPEYGNTETVTLGEMEMMGVPLDSVGKEKPEREKRRGDYDRGYDDRGYGRGYDKGGYDRGGYDRGGSDRRGYHKSDRNDYERRGYSNARRNNETDNRRGGYRSRDNEPRRGYNDRDYRDRSDRGSHRGYGDSYSSSRSAAQLPSSDDLYEEVRRRERANVTAQASRPQGKKPSPKEHYGNNRHGSTERRSPCPAPPVPESAPVPTEKKRSAEEIAAQQEKKRKLMSRYG